MGEFQLGRLEKKPSTLSTLCQLFGGSDLKICSEGGVERERVHSGRGLGAWVDGGGGEGGVSGA